MRWAGLIASEIPGGGEGEGGRAAGDGERADVGPSCPFACGEILLICLFLNYEAQRKVGDLFADYSLPFDHTVCRAMWPRHVRLVVPLTAGPCLFLWNS